MTQHVATAKHVKSASLKKSSQRLLQDVCVQDAKSGPANSQFFHDISHAFVAADIPLHKLQHPILRETLEKYIKLPIPDESTLRKHYVPKLYSDTINRIREEIGDSNIWVTMDEATDAKGRYVANVIVGTLKGEPSQSFLLTCECLEKTNNNTIAKTFNDAMILLWPNGIQYSKVHLIITDGAPYMIKA